MLAREVPIPPAPSPHPNSISLSVPGTKTCKGEQNYGSTHSKLRCSVDIRVCFRLLSLYPKKNHSTGGLACSMWDVVEKFLVWSSFESWDFQPIIWPLYGFSGSGMWGNGMDRAGWEQGQLVGAYECNNKPAGSMKGGEFLDWLRNC